MVAAPFALDASILAHAALAEAGQSEKKACRRQRRGALRALEASPGLAVINREAAACIRRSCGLCGGCRGV